MTFFQYTRLAALVLVVALLAGCGSAGNNEGGEDDDESTFPEPPGRPNSVQVDTGR